MLFTTARNKMAPKKRHAKIVKKQRRKINLHALSYKQKQHLKEYGEAHPSDTREDVNQNYTQIKDVQSKQANKMAESNDTEDEAETEDEESKHPFEELLSTLAGKETNFLIYKTSSEDDEDDSECEEEASSEEADMDEEEDEEDNEEEEEDIEEEEEDIEEEEDDEEAGIGTQASVIKDEFPEIEDIVIDDKEVFDEDDKTDFIVQDSDPFTVHFEKDVEDIINKIKSNEKWRKHDVKVPGLGKGHLLFPSKDCLPLMDYKEKDITKLHIQEKLLKTIAETNETLCNVKTEELSPLQQGIFNVLNSYQDIYYTERTHHNQEQIRMSYCLHVINHIIKSRNRVISNNTKIKEKTPSVDEDHRDQGLTRPKVLILVPFRESAYKIVNILINLVTTGKKAKMMNRKRFVQEYHEEDEEDIKKVKPEDFDATFVGNIDDHFRFGVQICKSVIKLFSHFYMSDLIIASPLGLRTIIGTEGERGDHDFLSSIEIVILDQADVFIMQNFDHLMQILKKLHQQPKTGHGVDFSRVRMSSLEGWSKYYRQTAIFSSIAAPQITALFNKQCQNHCGKVHIIRKPSNGSICHIVTQLPQTFHRFDCKNFTEVCENRFDFFVKKVVPNIQDHMKKHTMIFIPSYFDFVRIRNYFAKEKMNFVQMNEYVKDEKISKYRWLFFVGKVPIMLYTERLHFYRRYKIRGIHHVVFYQLPHYPHFYSEICNMLKDLKRSMDHIELTCTVIYSKYDAQKLAETIGSNRAAAMVNSEKTVHMLVTGENS